MFMMRISGLYKSFFVVETHVYNSKDPAEKYENLNFLLLSVCFHFFENYPTQFLSHSESAELVFLQWGSQFSPFQKPKQDLQFWAERINFHNFLLDVLNYKNHFPSISYYFHIPKNFLIFFPHTGKNRKRQKSNLLP